MVLYLYLLIYFTRSIGVQSYIRELKGDEHVKLIINANSFYNYPWHAHYITDKSFYMYADNCCYFPFAYYSPSEDFK